MGRRNRTKRCEMVRSWGLSRRCGIALAAATGCLAVGRPAFATDDTWVGNLSGVWSTTIRNWTTGGNSTTWTNGSSDIAHFSSSSTTAISVSGTPNVGQISFENTAASYTISNGTFKVVSGGNVTLQSTAGTGVNEVIGTNFNFTGSYSFANNDPDPNSSLTFGGTLQTVSTTAGLTLPLSGTGAGTNVVSGTLQNGSSEPLGITVGGVSPWKLSGTNTYTGGTSVATAIANTTTPATLILNGTGNNVLGGTTVGVGSGGNGLLKIAGNVGVGTGAAGVVNISGGDGTTTGQGVLDMRDGTINTLTLNNNTALATNMTIGSAAGKAVVDLDVNSSGADEIVLSQRLAIGAGGAIINLNLLSSPSDGASFTLISTNGIASGSLSNLVFSNLSTTETMGGLTYTLAQSVDGNSELLNVSATPEPGCASFLLISSAAMLKRHRSAKTKWVSLAAV